MLHSSEHGKQPPRPPTAPRAPPVLPSPAAHPHPGTLCMSQAGNADPFAAGSQNPTEQMGTGPWGQLGKLGHLEKGQTKAGVAQGAVILSTGPQGMGLSGHRDRALPHLPVPRSKTSPQASILSAWQMNRVVFS